MQTTIYTVQTTFDALNRPVIITQPNNHAVVNIYNKGGLLEKVQKGHSYYISNIDYNARGQRTKIVYGNGSETTFTYDEENFRLTRLLTTRNTGNDILQDLNYTYDSVGNIVEVEDDAQQTIYFNNTVIDPVSTYEYDALYRLVEATGRELTSLQMPTDTDFVNNIPVPNTGSNAMQTYTQQYSYDALGNITQMYSVNQWTRDYIYDTATNRLLRHSGSTNVYTYDAHGNMLTMPHLTSMVWTNRDELMEASNGTVTSYYQYDSQGNRTRKVVVKPGNIREERYYIGGYEMFYKYVGTSTYTKRDTVHVSEERDRFVVIDVLHIENGITLTKPITTIRYQYSNHLGSACLELDSAAATISYEEYHPFGTTSYRSGRNEVDVSLKRYKYVGKERDEETGLYYYGARYYAAWLCRFVSIDPLQHKYPYYTPYQYAGNKPITYIDLDGLEEGYTIFHRTSIENASKIIDSGSFDPTKSNYANYTFFSTSNNGGAGAGTKAANSNNVVFEGNYSSTNIGVITKEKMSQLFNEGFKLANKELGTKYSSMSEVPKELRPKYQSMADSYRYNMLPEYMDKMGKDAYVIQGKSTIAVSQKGIKDVKITKLHASEAQFEQISSINKNVLNSSGASRTKFNFAKWGGVGIMLIAISFDVYEIFQSENKPQTIMRKAYGWTGAWMGATSFATITAVAGQCGPQIATPEEAITIPIASLLGGAFGYVLGEKVYETIDYTFTRGANLK